MKRIATALAFVCFAPTLFAQQDAIVFQDGYALRGRVGKELVSPILDGMFSSSSPFDYLNSGPRFVFFSRHTKTGAQVLAGIPDPKKLEFKRFCYPPTKQLPKIYEGGGEIQMGEFNVDGRRTIQIAVSKGQFESIGQIATFLYPTGIYLDSPTHALRQVYTPDELGVATVRSLLSNHPDLRDGWLPVPDPMKRMKIAQFFLECGWRDEARAELAKLKVEIKGVWKKEASDRFDSLSAEIDAAETKWLIGELDIALNAGQYKVATAVMNGYKPKTTDPKDLTKLAELKSRIEGLQPKFEKTRELLRELLDRESGALVGMSHAAFGGAMVIPLVPVKPLAAERKSLIEGGEAVFREMHPDVFGRLELFQNFAFEEDRRRMAGQTPKNKGDVLLALAVSGWCKGKNGATEKPDYARQIWNTRQMATAYLQSGIGNNRATILKTYKSSSDSLPAEELAQIVTLMPPIDAEDPKVRRGRLQDIKDVGVPEVYKIETGAIPGDSDGLTYYLRLPREYHHGRSYPLVIALNDTGLEAEKMLGLLAGEADRWGFIIAAPAWASRIGGKHFDFTGQEHRIASSTIRDVSRKFMVDQDRVLAFGFGEGADLALDLAMSKPDLFAGVVAMGPTPVAKFYEEYWTNAQKVPVYAIAGEMSKPSVDGLRTLFQNWLRRGYYGILSIYKGRGNEWCTAEVPTLFDWMSRKVRARGLKSLRMDGGRFDEWKCFRDTDDRFYWVGATELSPGNRLTKPKQPQVPPYPAVFQTDIIKGNQIVVKGVRGTKKITVWLERDMIDWTAPVTFKVDTSSDFARPVKLKPDIDLMFEELYRTGDRKMLFFGKFEFKTGG